MLKRVFLLNGVAIVAVVCSHATEWGETALTWWVDRWSTMPVPNHAWDGTFPYYLLLAQRKLAHFSVPAFMFVSGFFLWYAASGTGSRLTWITIKTRVLALLVPWLIWSAVRVCWGLSQGTAYSLGRLSTALLLGWPPGVLFWYPPVICAFYLMSPWLTGMARTKPILLLGAASLLHFGAIAYEYARLGQFLAGAAVSLNLDAVAPRHFLFVVYFVLGLLAGAYRRELTRHLKGRVMQLLFASLVVGVLAVLEAEIAFRRTSGIIDWRISNATLPTTLFSLAIILTFLAVPDIRKPVSKLLHRLGSTMYAIYLLHRFLLEFTARATQKYLPGMLAYPVLFQFVLVFCGVAGAMMIVDAASRTPLRKYSRYLFG